MLREPPLDNERGTVLLLFPAAMLIMFLLGAIVIDVSLAQMRGREVEAVAASAANDALAALDISALRAGDGIVIAEADAAALAQRAVASGSIPDARVDGISITRDGQDRTVIAVTVSLDVRLVMAPSIGSFGEITIRRTERAVILGSDLL